jgi:RNA polymerase sigma-70 factor (ECF subfamily)
VGYEVVLGNSDDQDADYALARRALRGDRTALDIIVASSLERVYDRALRMLKSSSAAEDVTQLTFVRVMQNLSQYKGDRPLSNWIISICRNACLDELRRQQRHVGDALIDDPSCHPSTGPIQLQKGVTAEDLSIRLDLEKALDALDEVEREAFILICVRGHTSKEAAEYIGVEPSTVRSRVARAKRQLIVLMDEYRGGQW